MFYYLTNTAKTELNAIRKGNSKAASRIKAFIDSLENVGNLATLSNARKLAGMKNVWRFRIGDYRIESRILKIENGLEIPKSSALPSFPKKMR